jgi:hypothetical protein
LGVWSVAKSLNGQTETTQGFAVAVLVGTTSPDAFPASAYHTPRLALDYVTPVRITIGAAAGVFFAGSSKTSASQKSTDGPGLFNYILEPRVGYYLPLGDHLALWPRLGFTLFGYSQSNTSSSGQSSSTTVSGFALDLEPTFVLRPSKNTGLTVSALADLGLGGSVSESSQTGNQPSPSVTAMNYGLTFGGYIGF